MGDTGDAGDHHLVWVKFPDTPWWPAVSFSKPDMADPNDNFCAVCMYDDGSLVCCDNCPNAFHADMCLYPHERPTEDGQRWHCPRCPAVDKESAATRRKAGPDRRVWTGLREWKDDKTVDFDWPQPPPPTVEPRTVAVPAEPANADAHVVVIPNLAMGDSNTKAKEELDLPSAPAATTGKDGEEREGNEERETVAMAVSAASTAAVPAAEVREEEKAAEAGKLPPARATEAPPEAEQVAPVLVAGQEASAKKVPGRPRRSIRASTRDASQQSLNRAKEPKKKAPKRSLPRQKAPTKRRTARLAVHFFGTYKWELIPITRIRLTRPGRQPEKCPDKSWLRSIREARSYMKTSKLPAGLRNRLKRIPGEVRRQRRTLLQKCTCKHLEQEVKGHPDVVLKKLKPGKVCNLNDSLLNSLYSKNTAVSRNTCSMFNGISGLCTQRSGHEVIKCLELEEGSVFVDLGSGTGIMVAHAAVAVPGVAAVGVEVEPNQHIHALNVLQHTGQQALRDISACVFNFNIEELTSLFPCTHVYVFSMGMQATLISSIFDLVVRTDTVRRLAIQHCPPEELTTSFRHVKSVIVSMGTSGQKHTINIYDVLHTDLPPEYTCSCVCECDYKCDRNWRKDRAARIAAGDAKDLSEEVRITRTSANASIEHSFSVLVREAPGVVPRGKRKSQESILDGSPPLKKAKREIEGSSASSPPPLSSASTVSSGFPI